MTEPSEEAVEAAAKALNVDSPRVTPEQRQVMRLELRIAIEAATPRIIEAERERAGTRLGQAIKWYEQEAKTDSMITPWAILTWLDGRAGPDAYDRANEIPARSAPPQSDPTAEPQKGERE